MSEQTDPDFLKEEAYADANDLKTRIEIQERFGGQTQRWFPWLFNHFRLTPYNCILELGCGPGDLWTENRELIPEGCKIILTDLSFGMLAKARDRLSDWPEQFSFGVSDIQNIAFPAVQFEAVIGIGLLDHVANRDKALQEVQRILKPGGYFYASAGGRNHFQELENLVRPFIPQASFGGDPGQFGLENGEELLSPWFIDIQRSDYPDRLIFCEVDPVLEYINSERTMSPALTDDKRQMLKEVIRQELVHLKNIEVTIEKGLFTARKTQ
jgi:SAM-dependent methyltransferase